MASISQTANTNSSITVRITGLNSSSTYPTMKITLGGATKSVSKSSSSSTTSTTAEFTGLLGGTSYTAQWSITSGGGTTASGSGTFYTKPNQVTGVSVGSIANSSAYVTWSLTGSASSYRVTVRQGSSSGSEVATYYPTSKGQTLSGLSSGTTYYVGIVGRNAVGDEGYSGSTTFTTKAVAPSTPSISSVSSTRDSVTVYWGSVSGATSYTIKLMNSSGSQITTGTSTSTSYTFNNLSSGTYYMVAVMSTNSGGSSSYSYSYTKETLPSAMSSVGLSTTTNTMTGSWSNGSASSFRVVLRRGSSSSGSLVSEVTTTSSNYTFTGLSENAQYYMGVEPFNSSGESGASANNTAYTKVSPPTTMSISASTSTSFTVAFTGGASSGYTLRAYRISTGALTKTVTGTTSPLSVTGLSEYVEYRLELTNKNASGVESTAKTITQKTKDATPPVIAITSTTSEGAMKIEWSASDSGSGLRKTSTYAVSITSNGGTTYVHKDYTTNKYYSFIEDANGNEFVDGGKYYMRVTAFDEDNNSAQTTSGVVTYKRSRPANWNWQVSKTKGQKVEVTAQEWNSLCTRINQFRQYKKFDNYTFTEVKKGDLITATVFNQARNALSHITTNSNLPSTVSKGTTITASHFNGLTTAMNSIT